MERLIFIFILLGIFINAQKTDSITDRNWMLELGTFNNFSSKKTSTITGFSIGYWHRFPTKLDARLELGTGFKFSGSEYQFDYKKEDEIYAIKTKEYIFFFSARMVKPFQIKNRKLEWITELATNTIIFDGKDIPDPNWSTEENAIFIDIKSITVLQFGQGLRFWIDNIGITTKASCAPYKFFNKKSLNGNFDVVTAEIIISYKF